MAITSLADPPRGAFGVSQTLNPRRTRLKVMAKVKARQGKARQSLPDLLTYAPLGGVDPGLVAARPAFIQEISHAAPLRRQPPI